MLMERSVDDARIEAARRGQWLTWATLGYNSLEGFISVSRAIHAETRQTDVCMVLSAVVLSGLALNSLLGWWWADPVAALLIVPFIAREGREALHGHSCCGCLDDRRAEL
jgi:divalent metal cation (Fe/Co/Zn/Cd) transporter